MTMWLPDPQTLPRPVYRSLAEQVINAIQSGELERGERLPTHRYLSEHLGVSVQTVSRAYDELVRRGFISGEIGRGSFVRNTRFEMSTPYQPQSHYGPLIDCSILKPVCEDQQLEWVRETLVELGQDLPASAVFAFRPTTALHRYQASVRRWLMRAGLGSPASALILTNGCTAAMNVALMTAVSPGALVLCETLTHHALKPVCHFLGLRLQSVETDEQGMCPAAIARVAERSKPAALYLMPNACNPRASMMSLERREAIVEIARSMNLILIENDAWGPLLSTRPRSLVTLAPERTLGFSGLSKCLLPGLRLGFLMVPETLQTAAENRHLASNWSATPLVVELAARWFDDGRADLMVKRQRQHLSHRHRLAERLLHPFPYRREQESLHFWLPLPVGVREAEFLTSLRNQGVSVAPGSSFAVDEDFDAAGVRVSLGVDTLEQLQLGLTIIATQLRNVHEPQVSTF